MSVVELQSEVDLLTEELDAAHAALCRAHLRLFSLIARLDRAEHWADWGAHDMAHWLSMRFGMSWWQARRWVRAAHALEALTELPAAFSRGALGLETVLELCRFVTPETERELVAWARGASRTAVRRRADRESRRTREHLEEAEQSRSLSWWYFDDGRRFGLQADLPAADGAVVAKALDRLAAEIRPMPDEQDDFFLDARRADALVALASTRIAGDPDPDRATVVIHATLDDLVGSHDGRENIAIRATAAPSGAIAAPAPNRAMVAAASGAGGSEIDGGPVLAPETARRLACTARIQTVVENEAGDPVGLGRLSREPSEWMLRQLRHRDGGCTFPSCGARRFANAHHIEWWSVGGRTDLDNLAMVCTFHHKLVHEYGWRIHRSRKGDIRWYRPDGRRFRAHPGASNGVSQPTAGAPP